MDKLGAVRLTLARQRYLRFGPQRGLERMVAFAALCLERRRRPSYMLQRHIGGRRRRICDIGCISRTIRCNTTSTDEGSSDQWLDGFNQVLMAQPCELGAAPHPRPPTERWLPAMSEYATNHDASTTEHLPHLHSHCPITRTFSAST
jgi:hypothetical protein